MAGDIFLINAVSQRDAEERRWLHLLAQEWPFYSVRWQVLSRITLIIYEDYQVSRRILSR
jgi:hypothetical protein